MGPTFSGLLLKESLKDEQVLGLVRIIQTEVWDVDGAEGGQPEIWTAITFEGDADQADRVAEALSEVMRPEWYANFSTENQVFVIFENRFFKYSKGDTSARSEAEDYAISVGIPKSQVDWAE